MRVKLIKMTEDPINVMWTAARTCYSAKSPNEMWDNIYGPIEETQEHSTKQVEECTQKHWKLVTAVLDSGHQSIAEQISFTFAIEGISRACANQLTRHRAGIVFSQQSQRYVEIKEDISLFEGRPHSEDSYLDQKDIIEVLDKYFVWDHSNYSQFHSLITSLYCYLYQTKNGVKAEDARAILPNATKTNITMTVNFRELIHLCNLRLCQRSQSEIRTLFREIVKCVKAQNEHLATYLVPQCEVLGLCTEKNCCGRKPTLKEIMDVYDKYKGVDNNG